jgi:hypothetical protein
MGILKDREEMYPGIHYNRYKGLLLAMNLALNKFWIEILIE